MRQTQKTMEELNPADSLRINQGTEKEEYAALKAEINKLKDEKQALLKERDRINRTANVYGSMVYKFIRGMRNVATNRRENSLKSGCYPFIPLSSGELLILLNKLHQKNHLHFPHKTKTNYRGRFLDAGAGIGNQVLLADSTNYFFSSHGVEYDPRLVEVGNKLHDPGTIIHGDITTFANYADYDVVYYYVPMNNREWQMTFEEKLEDDLTVGSLIIAFGKNSPRIMKDPRFEKIDTEDRHQSARVFKKVAA